LLRYDASKEEEEEEGDDSFVVTFFFAPPCTAKKKKGDGSVVIVAFLHCSIAKQQQLCRRLLHLFLQRCLLQTNKQREKRKEKVSILPPRGRMGLVGA
jgi:hypothetical protein